MPISYICALGNPDAPQRGMRAELFYSDPSAGAKFARRHNGPGVGIYCCLGKLRDGATRRCKEEVVELGQIIVDLDLKNIVEPREDVLRRLRDLVLPPSEIRDSGNGLHPVWDLKEPVVDAAGLEQAENIMKRLVGLLAGDPAPTHRAALLRMPGTDNTKFGQCRRCEVIERPGGPVDISE